MTFDAVTTYAERHWESHAARCVSTFNEHWSDVPLFAFTDGALEMQSPWLADFKKRHAGRPTHNYRLDAVRFSHKIAAIELAYSIGEADVLIWMDADCVTHADVEPAWLEGLIGGADLAILKRRHKYTEGGFMMFRRGACDRLIADMVQLYTTDVLFTLPEWHDCWALDHTRASMNLKEVSLSGDAEETGHPLVNGPLGERLDHLKGKRKEFGRSLRADIKRPRKERYWN